MLQYEETSTRENMTKIRTEQATKVINQKTTRIVVETGQISEECWGMSYEVSY